MIILVDPDYSWVQVPPRPYFQPPSIDAKILKNPKHTYKTAKNHTYVSSSLILTFEPSKDFFEWIDVQEYTKAYATQLKNCFKAHLINKTFETPLELQKHLICVKTNVNNVKKAIRAYIKYASQQELISEEVSNKYKAVIQFENSRKDYFVPTNEQIIANYELTKDHKALELVYLVLATSGIRYVEGFSFLKTFNADKVKDCGSFISYNVSDTRNTKTVNNIYLPKFVYSKICEIPNSFDSLRVRLKKKNSTISLKYLRKWHYNFMLYNGVPESVADFIQGRASKSVSANHYLAKSQQAEHWYSKIVSKLEALFITTQFDKNLCQISDKVRADDIQSKETILNEETK